MVIQAALRCDRLCMKASICSFEHRYYSLAKRLFCYSEQWRKEEAFNKIHEMDVEDVVVAEHRHGYQVA